MKSFLLASATLALSASLSFGDDSCNPHPLRPDGRMNCVLQMEGALMKASLDNSLAQQSARIEAARRRYWALSPSSPQFNQAEKDFYVLLRQKDAFYLAMSTSLSLNILFVKAGNALAALSGDTSVTDLNKIPDTLDGGIRPYARPLFARWVAALRRREDKRTSSGDPAADASLALMQSVARLLNDPSANPALMVDAMRDNSHFREAYEDARNWAELLASGVDISRMDPEFYIRGQMEADVSWTLGQNKPDDLPEPVNATHQLYTLFVQMFGEKQVRDAASATLKAPKNSVGGLATRSPVEIGEFVASPSPNPYYLFLSQVTKSSSKAYAIALAFDPNTLLTVQPAAAFSTQSEWQKAYSVYLQLKARYGEANVLAAAGRLKDTPKDAQGRIAGDPQSQPLRFWFQALLKDSNAAIPDGQVAHFRASSYDPRWLGKPVVVRGTVAGVDVDTSGMPQYATIRFKDSRPDGFVAFSPYPDMLQSSYGDNFAGLIGRTIEVQGDVQSFGQGAGVRILSIRQLKVLDAAAASADFRESRPAWLTGGAPVPATVDAPEYLAWKKFPPGTKAILESRLLSEVSPGTDRYTRTLISRITMQLDSVDEQRVIVTTTSTIFERNGQSHQSPPDRLIYPARRSPPGRQDDTWTTTTGQETLVINGRKIATKWESVARANDPMTFTKTWRSDDVPGGLVHQLAHEHTEIGGKPFRTIRESIYAPIDGVMPVLGDATPPAQGNGAPATPVMPQNRGVSAATQPPGTVPNAASNRVEFLRRYNAALSRFTRARMGLAQFQTKQASSGAVLPADVAAAAGRLEAEARATRASIGAGNDSITERNLSALEDSLKVIEDFLAK